MVKNSTMWAACCNWLCLDRQTEEIAPRQHTGSRTQAYSNPGYSTHPTSMTPSNCRGCGDRFENAARKHSCIDCGKNFCNLCSNQPLAGPRLCSLCQRFRSTHFVRSELMKMKVKDLRDYLSLHDVSTEMCREKEDLVDLVLSRQPVTAAEPRTPSVFIAPEPTDAYPIPSQIQTSRRLAGSLSSLTDDGMFSPGDAAEHVQTNGTIPLPRTNIQSAAEAAAANDDGHSTDSDEVLVPGRRCSLSDLESVEDIEGLTVRQLKEILARNFVNYKGCCEKWELMERVTRLYNETHNLRQQGEVTLPGSEDPLCKICMDSPIDCVLLECGHMVTCTKCGKRMNECPMCRQYVVRAVHVFRS